MTKFRSILLLLLVFTCVVKAGNIDDIRQVLEKSSTSKVQEKVYIHTDNQCYFVGDTLWYKAYVVRADDLKPTNLSRVLYVELLSPDGLLVERQNIVINAKGFTSGQFVLTDSLYSGYYEIRAYTRWMLNFNVRHHRYRRDETWWFYNKEMAADYFRVWDGLYSRVLPIYSKPSEPGNYDAHRMYQRPKTRLPKQKKPDLEVTFFPEGGHLIENVENHVAFEAVNQFGEAVNISGTVTIDGTQPINIKTEYMGRGSFILPPTTKHAKARFTYLGKNYSFNLPKPERQGVTVKLENGKLNIQQKDLPQDKEYGLSIMCRGVLKHFTKLNGASSITLPMNELPTGVNDLTVFDSDGQILADRLFFVNQHDMDNSVITADIDATHTYAPYEKIEIPVHLPAVNEPTTFSLSIRDTYTDEPSYDNATILTDLLLSSELKGFVAYPAHYFEKDDELHQRHLDLLMLVQGWRKYKWEVLADTAQHMRYEPERGLTIEGSVYKMLSLNEVEPDEVENWQNGVGMVGHKTKVEDEEEDPFAEETETTGEEIISAHSDDTESDTWTGMGDIEYGALGNANDNLGVNHSNLRYDVLVEAELSAGGEYVGGVMKTENGRFVFNVPPFYGNAFLNMKAYKENDSIKKNMASRKDRSIMDEDAYPDFYVKRDLFYPMYTHDYTFYEKHQPDYDEEMLIDTLSEFSMENDVHQLQNVSVTGHRRGRRAIDWNKPAFVMDAYDLYNDITDRGLSFGKLDMRQFPVQVSKYLYGNMNRYTTYNVDGRIGGAVYYRNYNPDPSETAEEGRFRAHRTSEAVYKDLKLKRLQDIRVFSDYEPRTEDSTMVESIYSPDVTVELVTYPNDGAQITFRDRHILFRGFNQPEQFYQPDYSNREPGSVPADYRRTLYWNPNAVSDENGQFTASFYNNAKETRLHMTAAGIASDGRLLHAK